MIMGIIIGELFMIIRVSIPGPFPEGLDYRCDDLQVCEWMRVLVPYGRRDCIGIVTAINVHTEIASEKLKSILKRLDDTPIFSPPAQAVMTWMANYYHASIYEIAKIALPKKILLQADIHPTQIEQYRLAQSDYTPPKNAHAQQGILNYLSQHASINLETLTQQSLKRTALKTLIEKGAVQCEMLPIQPQPNPEPTDHAKTLTAEQQHCVDFLCQPSSFSVSLLYGITGSGKTEVYLQTIERIIQQGKQVLVLVPEINLTPQTMARFEQRFATTVIAIHSRLTDQQRLNHWHYCKYNQAQIIISTRSGLLYDFANLGMIIVDEEHDGSYKQQSGVRYHARDCAIIKARQHNIPIVLGSATPSIETYHNAKSGKYHFLKLSQRPTAHQHSPIHLVDLTKFPQHNGLSHPLVEAIDRQQTQQQQSLILINRRGYASALICKQCGWCAECEACDKPYTLHHRPQHLACHFCGDQQRIMTACPSCGDDALIALGSGTEKVEVTLAQRYGDEKIIRFDRSETQLKGELEHKLQQVHNQQVDIIVGTQMIAKGHHFERVTLVGVLGVDGGFNSQDFHASERTGQLITQVAGRAGRGEAKGMVLIQTYQPNHPLLQILLSQPYEAFLDQLLESRSCLHYPPYSTQAVLYFEAVKETEVRQASQHIYQCIGGYEREGIEISHPIPAIHFKQAGKYRYYIIITTASRQMRHHIISEALKAHQQVRSHRYRLSVDIDPIYFE